MKTDIRLSSSFPSRQACSPPRQFCGDIEQKNTYASAVVSASASASAATSVSASLKREVEFTAEINASAV